MSRTRVWSYLAPLDGPGLAERTLLAASGTQVRFGDGVKAQCARSGLWNVNFGYGNPAVADAVHNAISTTGYLPLFRTSHIYAERAAESLLGLLGERHFDRILYSTSGSAANDAVMKMVRQWAVGSGQPERDVIVALKGSYHGQTYGSMALTGEDLGQVSYGVDQRRVRHVDPFQPEAIGCLLDQIGHRVAAIVIEPVLGSGTKEVPYSFIETVLTHSRTGGFLVVADEVATGFLRTGPIFAHSTWSRKPDMVVMSKGLTNGVCGAAAVAVGYRVTEPFHRDGLIFVHGETQGGSPGACAAMETVANIVSDDEFRTACRYGSHSLAGGLNEIVGRGLADRTTGRGWFRSLSLVDSDGHPLGQARVTDLTEQLRRDGLWVYPGPGCIQIIPPVVTPPDRIGQILEILENRLSKWNRTGGIRSGQMAV